jgi:hypothetical protein
MAELLPPRPSTAATHHKVLKLLSCPLSAPKAWPCQLGDQPVPPDPQLGPHASDRPALLDMAALQVAGQILEAQLCQPLSPLSLPGSRVRLPAPLAGVLLPSGPPGAPDALLIHESTYCPAVGAELGGHVS